MLLPLEAEKLSTIKERSVSFGRNETFPLRFGWLTKGFQALQKDPELFENEDAPVILGVGVNMVRSIRYWMVAARIAEGPATSMVQTPIGKALFSEDGWDPYLEDEATIWTIHWLLASNPIQATTIYWFFNWFHKTEFSPIEIQSAIKYFIKERIEVRVAANTVNQDLTTFLRMYVPSTGNKRVPMEEALDSPVSLLELIRKMDSGRRFLSEPTNRSNLPLAVVGYSLSEVFEAAKQPNLPIETIMRGNGTLPAIGSIFRLTEEGLIEKLEKLTESMPGVYEIRETAGLRQIFQLKPVKPLSCLKAYYTGKKSRWAA